MQRVRVALIQKQLGIRITHKDADEIRSFRPHFVCFPEYFFVNKKIGTNLQTIHNFKKQRNRIKTLSKCLNTVVIGGTTPEISGGEIYNTSFVFDNGRLLGYYRKRNLYFTEHEAITPGDSYNVFSSYGIKFGILICADVFKDDGFLAMRGLGARIVFIPTYSPKRIETPEEKFKRDVDIFVHGASISDAVIVKVCGVKSEFRDFLQARSLIADKNEVLYRVNPDEEEKEMIIKKEIVI
ncbi:MAG: carbon-nitrogen hydrolase family protein [Spirochaetota bacterium]|nr:carbon-nitrogen hydrolase family protein [Spirochaetota bacterium]